ncbi:ribonuclease P protein subunit p30 isoform X3 [Salmo salar]|uniref:Ribonuclease P protein subunit p30 isoform X3 n=1 Tax=Salmo salar TaxID=8030 RepID=A0ABM3E5N5_SALSA|nr:ribonuclease P protein subunit p30-like isoform X3 [Salmo salar]
MDFSISYTTDKKRLQSVIETAAHLGSSTVAINYVVDLEQNKQEIGKPKCVSELFGTFPIVQKPLREYKAYDLVAAYPKTEKLFHAACMEFTIDIICVAATEKQPFFFKRSSVNGAIERGVFFEVSYTPAIRDSMRRHTIANALNLMEACKGKNVIVTIGAERCDGANLCHCYYPERCPEAYCLACQKKMAKLLSHPTVEPSTYMEK